MYKEDKVSPIVEVNGTHYRRRTSYFMNRPFNVYEILRMVKTPNATGVRRVQWCSVPEHWKKVRKAIDAQLDS